MQCVSSAVCVFNKDCFFSAWASTVCIVAVQFCRVFELPGSFTSAMKLCKCVTWWCCVMSRSHIIKGGTTDKAFQTKDIFCGRDELPPGQTVLFNFQNPLHAQEWTAMRREKKHNRSSLKHAKLWYSVLIWLQWLLIKEAIERRGRRDCRLFILLTLIVSFLPSYHMLSIN